MTQSVKVVGLGVAGLWQALTLAKAGFRVDAVERSEVAFEHAASRLAGAMLAPFCERESAEPIIADIGELALEIWRNNVPGTVQRGSLVVVPRRDAPELKRFAAATRGFEWVDADAIAALEPDLAGRFGRALYFPSEAHVETRKVLPELLAQVRALAQAAGGRVVIGANEDDCPDDDYDWVVDCRGMAAHADLADLRGVRGEMMVVETRDVSLSRPVRLAHPRFPLYIVPWSSQQPNGQRRPDQGGTMANRFMIGATMIERADRRGMTVRSALDLLGATFTVHPAFAEAEIVEMSSDVRPAFPDNIPRVVVEGRRVYVNGMYRHGFLLAPALGRASLALLQNKGDALRVGEHMLHAEDALDRALAPLIGGLVVEHHGERNRHADAGAHAR